ncbi:MAG: dipeptidase [Gemmataceae bacterium]|nr:dipeptidase [Gemmataceae bacterium]
MRVHAAFVGFSAVLGVALAGLAADPPANRGPVVVTEAARKLHAESLVVDGHNDLPWELRSRSDGGFVTLDVSRKQARLHTDIPRLRAGGVGAQFWSAYVPVSSAAKGKAVTQTLEQIDTIHRLIARYPDTFQFAGTADDILAARRAGKIASLIGVEGGHSIDNSLGVLRMLYQLGTRYMTLTHSESLDWADSATDAAKSNGLSSFGEQVVVEMNRLGMLVDISHVSPETMKHALRITRAPVIASHSSAYSIAAHPRNVPDDVLKLVRENGGVIMVNFYSGFITTDGAAAARTFSAAYRDMKKNIKDDKQLEDAVTQWFKDHPIPRGTVHTVVDHIEHIIKTAGIDHVGLGSDYDGIPLTPEQLEDVSTYPAITQALLDRGYKPEEIQKVLGLNVLRVLRRAEAVSSEIRSRK